MKITDKNFLKEFTEKAKPYVSDYYNGKSALEVVSEIYLTLPDKTTTANMMAEHTMSLVEQYHAEFQECRSGRREFIENKLRECTKDMESSLERCQAYKSVLTYYETKLLFENGKLDIKYAESYFNEHKTLSIGEDVAPEAEKELYAHCVEVLMNAGIINVQLSENLEKIASNTVGHFEFGVKSTDIKAILSMLVYVDAINRKYDDITSPDMQYIVYSVCGAVDVCAVSEQIENKEIDELLAEEILYDIGGIIGIYASIVVIAIGVLAFAAFLIRVLAFNDVIAFIIALLCVTMLSNDIECFEKNTIFTAETFVDFGFMLDDTICKISKGFAKIISLIASATSGAWDNIKTILNKVESKF